MSAQRGALTLAALLAVGACDTLLVPPSDADSVVADFEAAWSWTDSVYPMFQQKGIDWDSVHTVFRLRAEAASGDEVYPLLRDLLEVPRDGHLYFQTPGGGLVYPYMPPRLVEGRHTFSRFLVRRYAMGHMGTLAGGDIEYGVMPGNIGYVRFATFDPENLWTQVPEAMATVRNTDGLVLDVRNNNGGERQNVSALVSSFLTDTLVWLEGFEADGVLFEPWEPIPPDPGRYTYAAPVVVLINGASISGAEILAETMKRVAGVTVVGDTTAGAACNDRDVNPGNRTLPSGIVIHIPTACLLRYDGLPMEWNGVPPDIRVPQTKADIDEGRDLQLEYALSLLAARMVDREVR